MNHAWNGYRSNMKPMPETIEAIEEFGPFEDNDLLRELRERGALVMELVPDCVGLSLASTAHGVTLTLVATVLEIAALDAIQYLFGGPCVGAAQGQRVIEYDVADALDEGQWQHFARATAAVAVSSTLSLPILVDGKVVGSVNLYAASAKAFTGLHEEIARIFDAWAPGAVTNADLTFSSREVARQAPRLLREDLNIKVAVGILAANGMDVDEARESLFEAARRAQVSEADLAATIIATNGDADGDRTDE